MMSSTGKSGSISERHSQEGKLANDLATPTVTLGLVTRVNILAVSDVPPVSTVHQINVICNGS
jgi:hypothetical protein